MNLLLMIASVLAADEQVFSGPQPGEKLPAFKVMRVLGPDAGKEVELGGGEGAQVIVFVHEFTRPALQLLRAIDRYGAKHSGDGLRTDFVSLSADRTKAEEYLQRAKGSLDLKCPAGVSVDGLEGPGAYGLNRKMTLTVLVGKGAKATANFAIIQPNETDAPKVLAEIAKAIGKTPPTADEIRALVQPMGRPAAGQRDPALTGLMRRMINKDNDEAAVKTVAEEMIKWAGDDAARKKQLADYCKQVHGLGYGTEHAKTALKRLGGG